MSALLPSDEDFFMDELSVLAFLADYELDNEDAPISTPSSDLSTPSHCDTLTTTWSDTTSSSAVSSPEKPIATDKKKSWRQPRKEEVLTLREVVKQLSAELERLKWAAGVHSTLPSASETPPVANAQAPHKTVVSVMWEQIAGRQSMLRQKSEDETAKLREALRLQLQQAKSLQRTIKRKLREDLVSSSMDLIKKNRLHTIVVTPPFNSKAVFDQLMVGLDEVYEGVDTFFEKAGMMELPCPGRRINSSQWLAKGKCVEFLDIYALPFDLRKTANVIWTPEKNQSGRDNLYYLQNFSAGSNTHMKSFCFGFSLQGLDFRVVMRSVTRKYVEKDRVVFITRSLIEPIYEEVSIHALTETSRMVLKRGDLSALGPTTVMQTHREADTLGFKAMDLHNLHVVGLENWDNNITRFNNSLEDQLINELTPPHSQV
ncbi:hypothetical protein PF005_g29812 [Phytophthora fragariae]|nr:hypothetical protein PF003_g29875 [Phytophthora fragariae]KAE9079852.1 hypothetical protein PF007_g23280 [Phytophthora fragariae]KAE9164947.1 hypothetical protein PF005_g29812 [Phytophthora fragariae]